MPKEINLPKIKSPETPREILAADFKSLNGELPICGGWGYTKTDACIIDKNDPSVDPGIPFDGVGIEYIFVEKRIYEEMIIFQSEGNKFSGIRWNLQKQQLIQNENRFFDQLIFEITAFSDHDWEELRIEWEGPQGHTSADFDAEAHETKRQDKMVRLIREFWFDITSFYGQIDTGVVEHTVEDDNLKYDLIDTFFDNISEYQHFLLELKVSKIATSDGKCIASLSKENDYYKYELVWEDGRNIGEHVKIFKANQENCDQFNKGCVEMARTLCVRVVVASIEQKSLQFDRAIERLHDNRIFTGV